MVFLSIPSQSLFLPCHGGLVSIPIIVLPTKELMLVFTPTEIWFDGLSQGEGWVEQKLHIYDSFHRQLGERSLFYALQGAIYI